jgi:hypothetical protein
MWATKSRTDQSSHRDGASYCSAARCARSSASAECSRWTIDQTLVFAIYMPRSMDSYTCTDPPSLTTGQLRRARAQPRDHRPAGLSSR